MKKITLLLLTVMVSDIRGFTTIADSLDRPHAKVFELRGI